MENVLEVIVVSILWFGSYPKGTPLSNVLLRVFSFKVEAAPVIVIQEPEAKTYFIFMTYDIVFENRCEYKVLPPLFIVRTTLYNILELLVSPQRDSLVNVRFPSNICHELPGQLELLS